LIPTWTYFHCPGTTLVLDRGILLILGETEMSGFCLGWSCFQKAFFFSSNLFNKVFFKFSVQCFEFRKTNKTRLEDGGHARPGTEE